MHFHMSAHMNLLSLGYRTYGAFNWLNVTAHMLSVKSQRDELRKWWRSLLQITFS